jgi:peptide/nickel transport system substrate-binding protein
MYKRNPLGKWLFAVSLIAAGSLMSILVACAGAAPAPIIVTREVVKDIIVEKPVIQEVVKEVIVEKEVEGKTIEKIVIVEKPVENVVEKTIVVEKEVIKEVEVEVIVTKEVVVTDYVVKEVTKTNVITKAARELNPAVTTGYVRSTTIPATYNESPRNAALVAAGKLPKVADRIGNEPNVITSPDGPGQWGGLFTGICQCVDDENEFLVHDGFVVKDADGKTMVPHLATSWSLSSDSKTWTFGLRKGMKWSDGSAFSADDYVFGFNHVLSNSSINANLASQYTSAGEPGVIAKVDDNTVTIAFADTYPTFINFMSFYRGGGTGYAHHIGTQWLVLNAAYAKTKHKDFNSNVDADAKAAGFDDWVQYFKYSNDLFHKIGLKTPVVNPWTSVNDSHNPVWKTTANPYFWFVDSAGNQQPYIEDQRWLGIKGGELMNLKFMAGEATMASRHVSSDKLGLFMINKDKQGYDVIFRPRENNVTTVVVNQTYDQDPEIRDWLRNWDFRRAIAYSLDRSEIHATAWSTLGVIRDALPAPWSGYYPGAEYENKYTEYSTDKANALLDKIGLDKKDADGWRQRKDGKGALEITVFGPGGAGRSTSFGEQANTIARFLQAVGIKAQNVSSAGGWPEPTNKQQLVLWQLNPDPWTLWGYVPRGKHSYSAVDIGNWKGSKGADGTDPASDPALADFVLIDKWYEEGNKLSVDGRSEQGKNIAKANVDGLYFIGTVGLKPSIQLLNAKVRGYVKGPNLGGYEFKSLLFFID